jgi:dynein heavy chain
MIVSGALRSADPNMSEDTVLMRALQDFRVPKIITTDMPVDMGLINGRFPAVDVLRERNLNWKVIVRQPALSARFLELRH